MSRVCDICGKKVSTGHKVSNSDRRTKRTWCPNLQKVRAMVDGRPQRITVCTSCIKAGKFNKPRHARPKVSG
jgi:large subunit ribosomal protein L28